MPKVWIGTPTTRDFSAQYISSLMSSHLPQVSAWDAVVGQSVDVGRNIVVKRFLDHPQGFDFLLMHDSDATWAADAIHRLATRNLPMVTAVIFKRGLPTVPTTGKVVSTGPTGATMYGFSGTINRIVERIQRERSAGKLGPEFRNELVFDRQPDDLEEIDGTGMHFCMIRRDVLEAIPFPWFTTTSANGGEDFDFCRKVQRAGFKMYVDYSVFTGHVAGPGIEIGVNEFLMAHHGAKVETVWAA